MLIVLYPIGVHLGCRNCDIVKAKNIDVFLSHTCSASEDGMVDSDGFASDLDNPDIF